MWIMSPIFVVQVVFHVDNDTNISGTGSVSCGECHQY